MKEPSVLDLVRREAFRAAMEQIWAHGVPDAGPNFPLWVNQLGAGAMGDARLRTALRKVTEELRAALRQKKPRRGAR